MTAASRVLAPLAALLAIAPVAAAPDGDRVVEQKRVVVRVEAGGESDGYSYAFVDHSDGEPVVLATEIAERGYLGASLLDMTPELRQHFGVSASAGVMISRIDPASPAAEAGLEAGDVLVKIDGAPVRSATEVTHRTAECAAGQRVELEVYRDGVARQVEATLVARERRQLDLSGLVRLPRVGRPAGRIEARVEGAPLIELDPESLERALVLMREHFDSARWQEQVELLGSDRDRLEARIREVREQLERLEHELRELPE